MNAGKILFDTGTTEVPKSTRYIAACFKFSNKKIRSGHFMRFASAYFPVCPRQMIATLLILVKTRKDKLRNEIPKIVTPKQNCNNRAFLQYI